MEWNGVQCWGRWGERGTEGGDRMGMGGGRREVEASGWGGRGRHGAEWSTVTGGGVGRWTVGAWNGSESEDRTGVGRTGQG